MMRIQAMIILFAALLVGCQKTVHHLETPKIIYCICLPPIPKINNPKRLIKEEPYLARWLYYIKLEQEEEENCKEY